MKNTVIYKKSITFILVLALVVTMSMGVVGTGSVYAADEFSNAYLRYEIVEPATSENGNTGTAKLVGLESGRVISQLGGEVKIPGKVTISGGSSYKIIGVDTTFFGQTAIKQIDLSEAIYLETITNSAFSNAEPTTLDFSSCSALKTIGNYAFAQSESTILDLSNCVNLETIGDGAFYYAGPSNLDFSSCSSLKTIGRQAIPNAMATNLDFSNCVNLVTISSSAFANVNATNLDFSNCTELEEIGYQAFQRATSVELDFSSCSSLKTIGNYAFVSSTSTAINFSNCTDLETIGYQAFLSSAPTELDFSSCSSLKTIGGMAFSKATNTAINFSNCANLEIIEAKAFAKSDVDTLDLSWSTKLHTISSGAFALSDPETVLVNSSVPFTIANNTFSSALENINGTIWYPKAYENNYSSISGNSNVKAFGYDITPPSTVLVGYKTGTKLKDIILTDQGIDLFDQTTIAALGDKYTGKWVWENGDDTVGYDEHTKTAVFKLDKNNLAFEKTKVTLVGDKASNEVVNPPVDENKTVTSSIKTAQKKIYLKKGQSVTLPLTEYTNTGKANSVKLKYKSSKKSVVSASSKGKIKAKKKGKAVITVTGTDGKTLKFTVYVANKATKTKAVKVKYAKSMKKGASQNLKVTISPKKATKAIATFSSSKKSVLTVDKAGKVTAKKAGKAKITIKAGGKKKVITIKVN